MRTLAVIAAGLLVSASAAFAGSDQDQAKPDPKEIICQAGKPVTGSLLPGPRECHTRKEWDDRQRQTQDGVSQMQVRSMDANTHIPGN